MELKINDCKSVHLNHHWSSQLALEVTQLNGEQLRTVNVFQGS